MGKGRRSPQARRGPALPVLVREYCRKSQTTRFRSTPISEPAENELPAPSVAQGHAVFTGPAAFCSDPVEPVQWQTDIVHFQSDRLDSHTRLHWTTADQRSFNQAFERGILMNVLESSIEFRPQNGECDRRSGSASYRYRESSARSAACTPRYCASSKIEKPLRSELANKRFPEAVISR
jgi:hypothetical protein